MAVHEPGPPEATPAVRAAVAVVINTYNQVRYLADAIESVLNQTFSAQEIVVVDDTSSDRPEDVVARYPGVAFVRQPHLGLAASRNEGIRHTSAGRLVFLDADDRLLPNALADGTDALDRNLGAAFAYGGFRRIGEKGAVLGKDEYTPIRQDAFAQLCEGNCIGMHATVMYRRDALVAAGMFDATLRLCEDYDLYLRIAKRAPIASYPRTVAEYRWHRDNISHDLRAMHAAVRTVVERHDTERRNGGRWARYYAGRMLDRAALPERPARDRARDIVDAARLDPALAAKRALRTAYRSIKPMLPPIVRSYGRRIALGERSVGTIRMGDLAETTPIHGDFGWGRGTPIDRYYVDRFLDRHRVDIKGRVLEIGDDAYSRAYGGAAIVQQDVLHVHADNPKATIVGDLAVRGTLPAATFDCIVLTQTLHLIFELSTAVEELHRALRPGGVLLLTVPGISQVDRGEWGGDNWFWSMTPAAVRRLFAAFGENIEVASHGNVFAATTFLQGMVQEEVDLAKLDPTDPAYPVIVTLRAVR